MNRLTISNGPHQGRRFSLRGSEILVGRGEDADIRLEDPEVDESHLVLLQQEDQLSMGSWASDREVLLNGSQAAEGTRLQPGDVLQIGATQLVFTNAKLHTGMSARRTGKMQRVTVGSIIIVLVLEALFIIGFSLHRRDQVSLETLRQEDIVVEEVPATEETVEKVILEPPRFAIKKANSQYAFDGQNQFQICRIRLEFESQRELQDDELEQVRVEGIFLEKVGTNAWSKPTGFMPNPDWAVHQRDQRRDRFYCLATALTPYDSGDRSKETDALSEKTILAAELRVYFANELRDETKIEMPLQDRIKPQRPNA